MNIGNVRFGSPEYKKLSTEERLAVLEEVVEAILANKKEAEAQPKEDQGIAALLENVETKDAILVCYRKIGPQTKKQLQQNLRKWGVPFGSWFGGGNFKNRLVDEGYLIADGEDEKGKPIYKLSIKGRKEADEIINKQQAAKQ
jgi:hypothetical protein